MGLKSTHLISSVSLLCIEKVKCWATRLSGTFHPFPPQEGSSMTSRSCSSHWDADLFHLGSHWRAELRSWAPLSCPPTHTVPILGTSDSPWAPSWLVNQFCSVKKVCTLEAAEDSGNGFLPPPLPHHYHRQNQLQSELQTSRGPPLTLPRADASQDAPARGHERRRSPARVCPAGNPSLL